MLWRLQCHQTGLFRQVTINQLFKPHYYTSSVVHYPICVAPSTVYPILYRPTCLAQCHHQVHQTAPQLQLNCSETLSHKTWHILPWFLCCTAVHWLSLYMSQRQNSLLIRQRWWTMKKLLENRYWRLWPMKCHSAQKIGGDGGKQGEKLWRPWTLVRCPSPVPPCNSTVEDFFVHHLPPCNSNWCAL